MGRRVSAAVDRACDALKRVSHPRAGLVRGALPEDVEHGVESGGHACRRDPDLEKGTPNHPSFMRDVPLPPGPLQGGFPIGIRVFSLYAGIVYRSESRRQGFGSSGAGRTSPARRCFANMGPRGRTRPIHIDVNRGAGQVEMNQ